MTRVGSCSCANGGRELEAGHLRHLDVGEQDVGPFAAHDVERFLAVARAGDDFDVAFDLEQRRQRAEEHGLILGDDDADHAERSMALSSGSAIVSVVPREASRARVPPRAAMRSRIPVRPKPFRRPSRRGRRRRRSGGCHRVATNEPIVQCAARECRTTFVTASRIASARIASCPAASGTGSNSVVQLDRCRAQHVRRAVQLVLQTGADSRPRPGAPRAAPRARCARRRGSRRARAADRGRRASRPAPTSG